LNARTSSRSTSGTASISVREHRSDHRPDAGIAISATQCAYALEARDREFEEKIVAGGTAFADHLDGRYQPVEVFVLDRSIAGHAGHSVEKEFKRPPIANQAFGQRAMSMDVSIDQSRHQCAVRSIDKFGILWRVQSGWPHC
jgi:hypothetical protein